MSFNGFIYAGFECTFKPLLFVHEAAEGIKNRWKSGISLWNLYDKTDHKREIMCCRNAIMTV